MAKIPTDIGRSLNKHISSLCPHSIAKDNTKNHCAHYVSHIMGYEFPGITCKNQTWDDKHSIPKGGVIRVDDLFSRSAETGPLSEKPSSLLEYLLFVTISSNIRKSGCSYIMGNNPKKHVGIVTKSKVWNYSNTNNKVVADTLAGFQVKFNSSYNTAGNTVVFYYGKFI